MTATRTPTKEKDRILGTECSSTSSCITWCGTLCPWPVWCPCSLCRSF